MMQVADTADGPRVRIRLEVAEPRHQSRPVLKKTTREHEVYEVDGFVFKKKRKIPGQEATEPPAEHREGQGEAEAAGPQEAARDDTPEQSRAGEAEAGQAAKQDTTTAAAPGFLEVCRDACSTALQGEDGAIPDDPATAAVDTALKNWLADMESDVATTMVLDENEINKSLLRTILSKLEAEERDWQSLEAQLAYQQPLPSNGLWKEMEDAFVSDSETEQVKQSLHDARNAAHQQLSLQVEAYSGLVTGVETLLRKAEQTCSIMQADYHKEKFRAFPHVDSPASLIKGLARLAK